VAIVENDACGTDAVQYLTGCTFGKGNLLFHDYGKQVYTFYHRATGRAVRVTPSERPGDRDLPRDERVRALLDAPVSNVVDVEVVVMDAPDRARTRDSVNCAFCGEHVMETRARIREGKTSCIPCASGT
jgi:formylmethanofuran dehydrogenase subunit E